MVAVFSGSAVKALLATPQGQFWPGSCLRFSILNRFSGISSSMLTEGTFCFISLARKFQTKLAAQMRVDSGR